MCERCREVVFSARHVNRLGIIDAAGALEWTFDRTQHQHQPTWVPAESNDDPEKNIPVCDNGHAASRVIEIDPRANEIVLTFPGQAGVPVLQRPHLRCRAVADAQCPHLRRHGRLFEVTRAGEVVWEWINPFLNTDGRGEPAVSIYRAHRYAADQRTIRP